VESIQIVSQTTPLNFHDSKSNYPKCQGPQRP
jgi:hypothetical protein